MEKSKWIRVEDRLPEKNDLAGPYGSVLIYGSIQGDNDYNVTMYCSSSIGGFIGGYKVTHWMPLPDPPEVKE